MAGAFGSGVASLLILQLAVTNTRASTQHMVTIGPQLQSFNFVSIIYDLVFDLSLLSITGTPKATEKE